MAATRGSKIASLVLRVVTLVLLFISLLVLATTTKVWLPGTVAEIKFTFKDFNAYRYTIAAIIIGAALSLLQTAFTLYHIITRGDGNLLFDLFSDMFLSYLLLSGAAAGLASGIDLRANLRQFEVFGTFFDSFFDKGNGASALLFLAFLCSAIVSILSSLALIKKT